MNPAIGLQAIQVRPGHPDFLDLPWDRPLEGWLGATDRILDLERGLSRHPVVFAAYESSAYAIKQMFGDLGEQEYEMLRAFEEHRLPAVEPVGHARVRARDAEETTSILITRFLDHSLPYRTLFMTSGLARYRERLLDAMASLLVRLHLAGVYWGDCSLSNTLFRRDAGELQAFLVDAETSEIHDALTEGQRRQDVMIMEENLYAELADLSQTVALPQGIGVRETGATIRERYERLWAEIAREESIEPHEGYRIHERIRALNELGFSVGEVGLETTDEGRRLRMRTMVTDRDYHRHQLHSLTGVVAGDRQAALMLNEIHEMQATVGDALGRRVPVGMAAYRWREERYRPAIERLSALRDRVGDMPELYCQVLEHKWYLSERAQADVGLEKAIADYVQRFQDV
jgi:Domain of unknown function (DUF4032)/Lipopolysaccharide kinase (Kdo/WaaP) family